jgi:hypothetical protein
MIIKFLLVLHLVLLSPVGPVNVEVEVPFNSKEACEFALKNGTFSADLPAIKGGSVSCKEQPHT